MTILSDVKDSIGVADAVFDNELLTHINMAVATVIQLGVTEFNGVIVIAGTDWPTINSDHVRSMVKTYIITKVKHSFDPTASATIEKNIDLYLKEIETRICVQISLDHH